MYNIAILINSILGIETRVILDKGKAILSTLVAPDGEGGHFSVLAE